MLRLTSLRLAGWKSIREMEPALELRALNVLIGANGAGKSNLIEFFKLLREMVEDRLPQFVARAGGANALLHYGVKHTSAMEAQLDFSPEQAPKASYVVRLIPTAPNGLAYGGERLEQGSKYSANHVEPFPLSLLTWLVEHDYPIGKSIRSLLLACRVFHFHDTSATSPMRQEHYIERNQRLDADGGNLAAMLYRYKQMQPVVYRRIVSTVRQFAPFFDDFVLEPRQPTPKNIMLNWRAKGHDYEFGPHQFSDGTLRLIALCTLLLQPKQELPALILLDEPELGLHPVAMNAIGGLLKAASLQSQVLVATQSAAFLNHFEPGDVVVADQRDGQSVFRRLAEEEYRSWLDEYTLGDLWERNVIGAGPFS